MASQVPSAPPPPAPQSVQFARGILLRFSLWPTLKTAVAEQWGGPESASKRDFLVGHLVDEYGMPVPSLSSDAPAGSSQAGATSNTQGQPQAPTPPALDMDDLTDLIQDYVEQEFECQIEDASVEPVARDLVALHRAIFITALTDGGAEAARLLDALEQAVHRLRGAVVEVHRQSDVGDGEEEGEGDEDGSGDEESGEEGQDGSADVDMQDAAAAATPATRAPPQVDEDGFTMVQSGRRRRH